MTAPTAPALETTLTRTIAALERVDADLKSIDLRSLPTKGSTRPLVNNARLHAADALKTAKSELKLEQKRARAAQ